MDDFVDAGIAEKRDDPAWLDIDRIVADEKDTFRCKVTDDIIDPDCISVTDEVGGNTRKKGDGSIEGELMLCLTGVSLQHNINTKNKTYTVL